MSLAGTVLAALVLMKGPAFVTDLRYNTPDNFLKKNVYAALHIESCYVHPDLAQRLDRLVPLLAARKLKLVFWDCFRPLDVQKAMWKIVPDSRYVADPQKGSNHNRGIAVDVTIAKEDGTPLDMPTVFDDFTAKASPKYACSASETAKCQNRELLIDLMNQVGLKPLPTEWWHFQLPAKGYPILPALHEPKSSQNYRATQK